MPLGQGHGRRFARPPAFAATLATQRPASAGLVRLGAVPSFVTTCKTLGQPTSGWYWPGLGPRARRKRLNPKAKTVGAAPGARSARQHSRQTLAGPCSHTGSALDALRSSGSAFSGPSAYACRRPRKASQPRPPQGTVDAATSMPAGTPTLRTAAILPVALCTSHRRTQSQPRTR
jgi:hypothetical protein